MPHHQLLFFCKAWYFSWFGKFTKAFMKVEKKLGFELITFYSEKSVWTCTSDTKKCTSDTNIINALSESHNQIKISLALTFINKGLLKLNTGKLLLQVLAFHRDCDTKMETQKIYFLWLRPTPWCYESVSTRIIILSEKFCY